MQNSINTSKEMDITPIGYKYILLIVLVFTGSMACAQLRFKKGDEFERMVIAKSNCVLQRGSQTLKVSSTSVVQKSYTVTEGNEKGALLLVTTDKLTDTINAMDQTMIYNSAKPADPNSNIHAGLQKLANARVNVSVNHKGMVLSAKRSTALNDTLLSFTGIQPEKFAVGSTLQFIVDFPVTIDLKKGYSWTVNTASAETVYTIYAISGRTTTVTYKISILGGNLNSRVNGSMLVDNNTGVILKRYSQSVSTGYEMVNGVVYTATRRTAVTEVSIKK